MRAEPKKRVATRAPIIVASFERRTGHEEDRELVRLSQAGSDRAFEQLVHRHQQHVFDLVGSILRQAQDIEDITQQVFLKTYRAIQRFDQRAAFSTWLYRIAVNECRDHLRKRRARRLVYESDLSEEQVSRLDGIASATSRRDGPCERMETQEALDRILRSLTDGDRKLLILREVEGFSIQELAEILGLNANTVKIRLFRARGRVADVLGCSAERPRKSKTLLVMESDALVAGSSGPL